MSITFKRKLNCSSEELQKEFKKTFPVINGMARTLHLSHERLVPKSQMELWQEFVKTRQMEFPHVCDLVRIVLATPPNSAWVEHAYSKLEQLCQKRRNQIDVNHFKDQFFLASLTCQSKNVWTVRRRYQLLQRSSFSYQLFTNKVAPFDAAIQSLYLYILNVNCCNPIVFLLIPLLLL